MGSYKGTRLGLHLLVPTLTNFVLQGQGDQSIAKRLHALHWCRRSHADNGSADGKGNTWAQ